MINELNKIKVDGIKLSIALKLSSFSKYEKKGQQNIPIKDKIIKNLLNFSNFLQNKNKKLPKRK